MSPITSDFSKCVALIKQGRLSHVKGKALGRVADYLAKQRNGAVQGGDDRPKNAHERQIASFVERAKAGGVKPATNAWWHAAYSKPLYDLGESGVEGLQGVYSPLYGIGEVDTFVHEQFRDAAEHHADKYVLHDGYTKHLTDSFDAVGFDATRGGLRVLDIGSGAGNTIVPLLNLLQDPQLVASELSTQMLASLRGVLARHAALEPIQARGGLLQLNAENIEFKPETFDLVVGGAILHHLFRPDKSIEACARILKPGGMAVFYDPFSNGNVMMQILFQMVLDHPHAVELDPRVTEHLLGFIGTIDVMRGEKTDPKFLALDDKWLFTRAYFQSAGRKAGFKEPVFLPLQGPDAPFTNHARVVLENYCDLPPEIWPDWARDIISDFENVLTPETKADLMIEGATIYMKPTA